jgi:hypothetical protein
VSNYNFQNNNHNYNNRFSIPEHQKNSLEGGVSTAADVDIINRHKKSIVSFYESFNKMKNKMKKLYDQQTNLMNKVLII